MRAFTMSLFVSLLMASLLPSQRRQPLVGEVVDAEGKPVPDAAVTLVEQDADLSGPVPADVCRTKTDARGRFVASALGGVHYTAVACTPEVDGRALVARPMPDQSCGQTCTLRVDVPGQRRRVAMPLAAELRAVPGLHVRMGFTGYRGPHVVLPIGEQGIELEPLAVVARFWLASADGAFLGTVTVPGSQAVAVVPSPIPLAVRVVDDTDQPVAGARVTVHDVNTGTSLQGLSASTDAEGRASLLWGGWRDPFESPPESLFVTATAPGFAEGASGWVVKQPFVGFEITKEHRGRVLVVPLTKRAPPPRGMVDRAFAGQEARLHVMANVQVAPGGRYFLPRSYDVVIADDGSYDLPQLPPGASTVRLQLPPLDGRPIVLLPTLAPELPTAEPSDCDVLMGQVIDQTGGPASGARVVLACHAVGTTLQSLVPDAAGRFERTLQRGRWTLLAMDATGWASCEIDGAVSGSIELRLVAKPQRKVRVVDHDGKAVAGASFEPGEFRYGMRGPSGLEAVLTELGWNTFADDVRSARTDERGETTLHFLPWPGVTPTAFAFVGDHRRRSDDAAVEAGDDVLVFRLR